MQFAQNDLGFVYKNRSATTYIQYTGTHVYFRTTSSGSTAANCTGVESNWSAFTWTTEYGTKTKYTHGFDTDYTKISLRRGSLTQILLQNRHIPKSCMSNTHYSPSSSASINFSTLEFIPREMNLYGWNEGYYANGNRYYMNDYFGTISLYSFGPKFAPSWSEIEGSGDYGYYEIILHDVCWHDSSCQQIDFHFMPYYASDSKGKIMVVPSIVA